VLPPPEPLSTQLAEEDKERFSSFQQRIQSVLASLDLPPYLDFSCTMCSEFCFFFQGFECDDWQFCVTVPFTLTPTLLRTYEFSLYLTL
jgi:hypothetical protein